MLPPPPLFTLFPYTTLFRSYYDPLKFMVEEAHRHGLEFHAWFNPYRAAMDVEKNGIDSSSLVFKQRPWFLKYGNNLYFDPGLPDRKSTRLNSSHVEISYAVF